ncbi:MAG TPA: xanthine dehydrogenase accessory protein XdhC, partial [Phaeodactylibacter sp.]|nr:xanthine dehydrogenase accessory protein XdhC [Phaeodactylibacter sp.]
MNNWINLLQQFKKENTPVALVTVSKTLGSTPCKVASKMIVTPQKIYGTIGGGKLEFKVIEEAILAIQENKIKEVSYTLGPEFEQCCGGRVELIIEPMNQSPQLFLFGAGHIGIELCKIMQGTP